MITPDRRNAAREKVGAVVSAKVGADLGCWAEGIGAGLGGGGAAHRPDCRFEGCGLGLLSFRGEDECEVWGRRGRLGSERL